MTDPRAHAKPNAHGYKKKPSRHREIQGVLTASGGPDQNNTKDRSHSRRRPSASGNNAQGNARIIRSGSQGSGKGSLNESESSDSSAKRKNKPVASKGQNASRRSQTQSTARRLDGTRRGRTLSPSRLRPLLNAKTRSSYLRKLSGDLFQSSRALIGDGKSKRERYDAPFDQKGCCNFHSNVKLAKKDKKGVWQIILDACPECNETDKPRRSRSSSIKRKGGKGSHAVKELKITNKSYNPTALTTDTNETPNGVAMIAADPTKDSRAIVVHTATIVVPADEPPKPKKKPTKRQ
jgi:hypothetical protein